MHVSGMLEPSQQTALAALRGFAPGFERRRPGGPWPFRRLRAHRGWKWL